MKHALRISLHAWLVAVLLVPASLSHAADDAPVPDYQAVITALFDKTESCYITGHVVDGIDYEINRITTGEPSLKRLREIWLVEKPRYLGREIPPHLGEYSSSRLQFVWKDAELKELGHAVLLEGDRLLINDSLLFTTSTTPGEKNTHLLRHAANFANRMTFATPPGEPNFRHIVSGFFAQAAACKITGYYDMGDLHMINYTTPDAPTLQRLKRVFLHERALYLGEIDPREELTGRNNRYFFTWVDARGTPLGRATLADKDEISLDRHSRFSTNSRGGHYSDVTLWLGVTRLFEPTLYTPQSPPPVKYHALVQDLFAKAASCRIEGRYAPKGAGSVTYHPDFTAADAATLGILKEIFLFEKPRADERPERDESDAEPPEHLYFTWKDAQGRELGRVSLLEGDRLDFKTTRDRFRTDPEGEENTTLYTRAARFALPDQFGPPALPDFPGKIQRLFATAAACRIQGYYTDCEADVTYDVDFTASDAAALLALKQSFLAEKPDYHGIDDKPELGGRPSSSLHFFWTDAQGKALGHVALLHDNRLRFETTHDLFRTHSGPAESVNTALLTRVAHLALPAIYGKPRPPKTTAE
ncbi:MAG: hypothetical protein JWR15_374 [Prosthecobacter sp.]|nr:hypothetical protein [Prosthecobacter sp.]